MCARVLLVCIGCSLWFSLRAPYLLAAVERAKIVAKTANNNTCTDYFSNIK
jgi:hypothetical protein